MHYRPIDLHIVIEYVHKYTTFTKMTSKVQQWHVHTEHYTSTTHWTPPQ